MANFYIERKQEIYDLAMDRNVTTGVALDMYITESDFEREKYSEDEQYFKTVIDVYTDSKITVNGEKVNQSDFFALDGDLPFEVIQEVEKRLAE